MDLPSLEQLRRDYKYLKDNIQEYYVSEDGLINGASVKLLIGTMNLKGFILWHIKDIVNYVFYNSENTEDKEFLNSDKRAIRILNRYNIEID